MNTLFDQETRELSSAGKYIIIIIRSLSGKTNSIMILILKILQFKIPPT